MVYGNRLLKNVSKFTTIRYSKDTPERNVNEVKDKDVHKKPSSLQYDIKEVENHAALANVWWDNRGPMRALHAMNEIRIPLIRNGLVNTHRIKVSVVETTEKYLTGVQILDVGCGGGILTEALARLGATVTGIDPSEELIKLASYHANNCSEKFSVPKYIATTVEEHSEGHRHIYDAVVASEVIEHVSNKESFIRGCIKAVKPGGSLFFTTPNKTWFSWMGNIIFAEYVLRFVPQGTHQYEKFISHSELSSMLEKEGCRTNLVNGMFYDITRNKWIWTSSTAFMYALHAVCKNEN